MLYASPRWANAADRRSAPNRFLRIADFARAATRRYPAVRRWMISGEQSRSQNFKPLVSQPLGKPITRVQVGAPRPRASAARRLRPAQGAAAVKPRDRRQHVQKELERLNNHRLHQNRGGSTRPVRSVPLTGCATSGSRRAGRAHGPLTWPVSGCSDSWGLDRSLRIGRAPWAGPSVPRLRVPPSPPSEGAEL
jgi:hypothetical protein